MSDDRAREHFDFIINGTNANSVCRLCGACVVDWHNRDRNRNIELTDDGWLSPNQIKHLAWHRTLGDRLAQADHAAAMFRPLGG